jgi:hypothetical protein
MSVKSSKRTHKEKDSIHELIKEITSFDDWMHNHDKELQKLILELNARESLVLGKLKGKEFLYPHLLDPNFNIKIANKKEFNDLTYDTEIKDVIEEAETMCEASFELAPHQIFVRNFLSFLTPYNSLLLYHGLGTGKTCSAISVCEEMRDYMLQMGIQKRIIIVASPNVQNNFKLQLFDERKLREVNGLWDLKACTGNKLIKEVNPMNMKGLSREKIIKQVNKIIKKSYVFMGYIEFSNYISKLKKKYVIEGDEKQTELNKQRAIKREFSNRLIVIDEVHNIRIGGDSPNKDVAKNLLDMVNYTDTLKLLLLSATPMFNSYREIIWLLNLMNINDGRPKIEVKDVFDKHGNFRVKDGKEVGKELLLQKMRGYVSFVRGENPYTFPYRIYPSDFNKELTLKRDGFQYPRQQLNGTTIVEGIEYLDIFVNEIGEYQREGYEIAKQHMKANLPDEVKMDQGMGWQNIELPLQTLNFVYPNPKLDAYIERSKKPTSGDDDTQHESNKRIDIRSFIGRQGLLQIMQYNESSKREFEYRPKAMTSYGEVFSHSEIGKYSKKMENVLTLIKKSKGIVLLYSQYIDGGCVPIALALESIGITRYNNDNLFKVEPTDKIDAITMKPKEDGKPFFPARYIMITGDGKLSPRNLKEIKAATNEDNTNGEKVKVIIISKAGSEGIDFNNIRQTHIIEPWYNMSRTDQIIGRAVRFRSHCRLPFKDRNVEIYLHGSLEEDNEEETIDMYIYRMAEKKSVQIGNVTRIMKEHAIDCYLNEGLNNLTAKNMKQIVELSLSSGENIKYNVGDKPFTQICDFREKCEFQCKPEMSEKDKSTNLDSYHENFIVLNIDKIISNIKMLFKERYMYEKQDLVKYLTHVRKYPMIQINKALDYLIEEQSEFLVDMMGRLGHLENIDNLYFFKPVEYESKHITSLQMRKPIDYKHREMKFKLSDKINEGTILDHTTDDSVLDSNLVDAATQIIQDMKQLYNMAIETKEVVRGDNNWYKHCSITIQKLSEFVDVELLQTFIVHHLVDIMTTEDKIKVIEYIQVTQQRDSFLLLVEEYINDTLKMEEGGNTAYILVEKQKAQLYILNDKKLKRAEPTDIEDFREKLVSKIIPQEQMNDFVGFMVEISNTSQIVFKTKNLKEKRSKGARCDQAGKQTLLKILNLIYDDETKYTKANSKKEKIPQLCSEQEFLLRYYNHIQKDGKKWFFNTEIAQISRVEKIEK